MLTLSARRHVERLIAPASLFGLVLGLAGLGNAWRVAHRVWNMPMAVGECLTAIAAAIWAVLLTLFILKWLLFRDRALEELRHPVNGSFVGLAGVATMLIAKGVLPYSRPMALVLFSIGAVFSLVYAVWQTGALWKSDRQSDTTTAALYLPTVAGCFVTGTVAAALGYADWGQLAFGAGVFSWISIESVLLHRLYTADELPISQRPSLGIQLAPPAVGSVTLMSVSIGAPDLLARALIGYALLQALITLRLFPWIRQQSFGPSYWAFTFGAASLATTPLLMIERGENGAVAMIAPFTFAAANVGIGVISIATIYRALRRRV